jgi:predicted metal-dependent hydrolase
MPNTHWPTVLASATARLSISVLPDGVVEVIAPIGTQLETIEAKLRKRGRWIVSQQHYFEQFNPRTPTRRHVGGETYLYLGRQYRLQLSCGTPAEVKLKGGQLHARLQNPQSAVDVKALLQGWYSAKANAKLRERYAVVLPKFERLISEEPPLCVRWMKRRWGSYSRSGRITLNADLVVVAHELAHVVHPHHGGAFYDLLDVVMADWRTRKHRLERLLA